MDPVFVGPVSSSLLCPICRCVFRSPQISHRCGHSFCKACIDSSLFSTPSCPLCRTTQNVSDFHVNRALAALIGELIVKCPNSPHGCSFECQLDAMHDHVKNCPFTPIPCPFTKYGCTFKSKDIKAHLENCIFAKLKDYFISVEEKFDSLYRIIDDQQTEIRKLKRHSVCDFSKQMTSTTVFQKPVGLTSIFELEKSIYVGDYNGALDVFIIEPGDQSKLKQVHSAAIWSVHGKGDRILTSSSDGIVSLLDAQSLQQIVNCTHPGKSYDAIFGDQCIYSACTDGAVRCWDMSGNIEMEFKGHSDGINGLCLYFNKLFSVSNDHTIKIWDINTGQCLHSSEPFDDALLAVCYANGMVYVSTYDAKILALDANHLQLRSTFEGHKWEVWQVQTDDNNILFSGSFDHTIKKWDMRKGELLETLSGHKGYIHGIHVGDDCVWSVSADKTIRKWQ